jgi:hypothetical protein
MNTFLSLSLASLSLAFLACVLLAAGCFPLTRSGA